MSNLELYSLIEEFGSHEFKSSGKPQKNDNWIITPSPIVISMIDSLSLDLILLKAVDSGYRDIYIASDKYIRGRKDNQFHLPQQG